MMEHKLSRKIIAALCVVIFIIISVYTLIFNMHYQRYEDRIIGQENIKTLHSLGTSIQTIIRNADEYSKMMLADSVVQKQMETGDLLLNLTGQSDVIKKIYSIFQFSDFVDSVWLIDAKGQKLTVGGSANFSTENGDVSFSIEDESTRFDDLQKPYGKYEIRKNVFGSQEGTSLVRSYNSMKDFHSLGIIGIDLNHEFLESLAEDIIGEDEQINVIEDKGEIFIQVGNIVREEALLEHAEKLNRDNSELLEKTEISDAEYTLAGVRNRNSDWKIIRYTPVPRERTLSAIVKFNIGLIIVIGILILLSAAVISSMLTWPIQDLMETMRKTESGRLCRIYKKPVLGEFRVLFQSYNRMVEQIEKLIQGTIDRQRRIRQAEMNEIQQQMNPHFLYNTLDSIQVLAMIGDSEKVCRLVEALGSFYRKSVSGGREMLTLAEEFQMAEDYVNIMKIRFENSFEYYSDLGEECRNYRIPKLTIQPLVENSFQHGIRAKEQFGVIRVEAAVEKDMLHISVMDNGDGIPDSVVEELLASAELERGRSLGLRGTIERLRLMYEEAFSYEIKNNDMTEIHLYIRMEKLEEQTDEQIEGSIAG